MYLATLFTPSTVFEWQQLSSHLIEAHCLSASSQVNPSGAVLAVQSVVEQQPPGCLSGGLFMATGWHFDMLNESLWRQLGNLDLDCHICVCWGWSRPQSSRVWTASSRYCRWRPSGLPSLTPTEANQVPRAPRSGLPSLATAVDDLDTGQPGDFPTGIDQFCWRIKVSPVALFLQLQQPLNPDTGSLHACSWRWRVWGVNLFLFLPVCSRFLNFAQWLRNQVRG